jgi:hypothetical protein
MFWCAALRAIEAAAFILLTRLRLIIYSQTAPHACGAQHDLDPFPCFNVQ